jgi:hypothetical protein
VTHDHRWLDGAAWLSAGVAAFSFWQGVALAVTIVAGLVSIMLGFLRLYDRLKYGPARGQE